MTQREIDRVGTYRVQLRPGFGFEAAAALAPYLAELGVSHLYTSPVLQPVPGSEHGYDVVDPSRPNEELGGEAGLAAMAKALREHGLGWLLDVVPNHMGIASPENRWFWDVLEHGPASRYASFFDIEWDVAGEPENRGKVVLPWLADPLADVLAAGDIGVESWEGKPALRVYAGHLPLAPAGPDAQRLGRAAAQGDRDALRALLELQHYRLEDYREAASHLNYRRFFHINDLVALRASREDVFEATHRRPLEWVAAGWADGLRIDHPDGMRDPERYLRRLRERLPSTWVVVEKILEPGEELPPSFPVDGTTGYEFLNLVGGLFVEPSGREPLTRLYRRLTGDEASFEQHIEEAKRLVLGRLFPSDVRRVTRLLGQVAQARGVPTTPAMLRRVVVEAVVALPVYRTYVRDGEAPSEADRRHFAPVLAHLAKVPDVPADMTELVASLFDDPHRGALADEWLGRFQQLSGPAMAKGLEDTAFFRYHVLISLNEVGGNPRAFGTSLERFHQHNQRMKQALPATLLATSTHDTKRGEDTRLRIAALSECPERWEATVTRLRELSRPFRTARWPDAGAEYLLYQTLVGAHPIAPERLEGFMEKAVREAKQHTGWLTQSAEYEEAVRSFARAVIAHPPFIEALEAFLEPVKRAARLHSLAQTLCKLTCPGVPDLYQGAELWDESLTDPDNRRWVDFDHRRALLARARTMSATEVMAELEAGLPKLWLIHRTLEVRHALPECFDARGAYEPLVVDGPEADRVVAFMRGARAATVAPRFLLQSGGRMPRAVLRLPPGQYHDRLADRVWAVSSAGLAVDELLGDVPVALLVRS